MNPSILNKLFSEDTLLFFWRYPIIFPISHFLMEIDIILFCCSFVNIAIM